MKDFKESVAWPKTTKTILEDVEDYWDSFKQPLMVSRLGKRQQRALKVMDITLVSACRELHKQKVICVFLTEKLTRYIIPMEERNKYNEEEFMLWKAGFEKDVLNFDNGNIEETKEIPTGGYFNEETTEDALPF